MGIFTPDLTDQIPAIQMERARKSRDLHARVSGPYDTGETKMKNRKLIGAFAAIGFIASGLAAQAASMMMGANKMTLYVFDKDKDGVSSCYDDCATKWPPYLGKEGDKMEKDWGLVKRTDGKMQWTYDNKPLYFFAGDKKEGDKTGDGLGDVWHIIVE
jgi:predicted lipoprotein with Yx(FWY)xxD motif